MAIEGFDQKMVLVTGATGRQGSAVARRMLEAGWKVRALVRNPNRTEGHALARLGVEVVAGDLDDRVSLERAVNGVHGVYSVQDFWEHGYEGEVRQGKNLIDAAATAGRIEHFIQSSIGGADRSSGVPHFKSKWAIEVHLRESGLPSTVLRPSFFMENFLHRFRPSPEGKLALALPGDRKVQMIAVDDLGAFAAIAFAHPEEWVGRQVELAGDEKSMLQVALLMWEAVGRPVVYEELPLARLRETNGELAALFEWIGREGWRADIEVLRDLHPQLTNLQTWLRHHASR